MDEELKKKFENAFGVKLKENPNFDDKEFKLKQAEHRKLFDEGEKLRLKIVSSNYKIPKKDESLHKKLIEAYSEGKIKLMPSHYLTSEELRKFCISDLKKVVVKGFFEKELDYFSRAIEENVIAFDIAWTHDMFAAHLENSEEKISFMGKNETKRGDWRELVKSL